MKVTSTNSGVSSIRFREQMRLVETMKKLGLLTDVRLGESSGEHGAPVYWIVVGAELKHE